MQLNTQEQREYRSLKRKAFWQFLLIITLCLVLIANVCGLIVGGIIYKETSLFNTHRNSQRFNNLKQVMETGKQQRNWQDVKLTSQFGYSLAGTYIPNPRPTDKTLIFVHGFSDSRLAGLHYIRLYFDAGYNLLLVDLRAHGDSGGSSITWGYYEKYDLDEWVDWVRQKFPKGVVGVHGVSMGAATALLHAGLNETEKKVSFYVADSAYSDFAALLETQISRRLNLPDPAIATILLRYADAVAYYDARFTFEQASPVQAVGHISTPVLFIHGENDKLVPPAMAEELYAAAKGPRQLAIIAHSGHARGIFDDWEQYSKIVRAFVGAALREHS